MCSLRQAFRGAPLRPLNSWDLGATHAEGASPKAASPLPEDHHAEALEVCISVLLTALHALPVCTVAAVPLKHFSGHVNFYS